MWPPYPCILFDEKSYSSRIAGRGDIAFPDHAESQSTLYGMDEEATRTDRASVSGALQSHFALKMAVKVITERNLASRPKSISQRVQEERGKVLFSFYLP